MEHTKEIIRARLGEYLESLGINTLRNFACLLGHSVKQSHMSYSESSQTVKCFSCDASGDIFDVMGFVHGIENTSNTFPERFNLACDAVGMPSYKIGMNKNNISSNIRNKRKKPVSSSSNNIFNQNSLKIPSHDQFTKNIDNENNANLLAKNIDLSIQTNDALTEYTNYFKKWQITLFEDEGKVALDYLHEQRKISLEVLKKYKIGYDKNACGGFGGIIIPTSSHSFVTGQIVYNPQYPKYMASKGTRHHLGFQNLFGTINKNNPCFVVEGELDMLTIETCGFSCVALGGTQFVQSFIKKLILLQEDKDTPIRPLILALDNDEAGRKATENLSTLLDKHAIQYLDNSHSIDLYGQYKDANEIYCHSESDNQGVDTFITKLRHLYQAAEILPDTQTQIFATFTQNYNALHCPAMNILRCKINGQIIENVYSTGFNKLDIMLGGGLRTGLYCLGGMPSTGKTTFVLQIADSLALNGQSVLFFTIEMSAESLIAKSISRLTRGNEGAYNEPCSTHALYDQTRSYGQTTSIQYALEQYERIGANMHIIECFDSNWTAQKISEEATKYMHLSGKQPIIIVDYLQIVPPSQTGKSMKDTVDDTAKIFKQLASKADIPVIVLSNMNRDSYGDKVLQQEINDARETNPRMVELSIIKQRSHSAISKAVYSFTGAHNNFEEQKNLQKNKVKSYMSSFKESGGIEYSADVLLTLLDFIPEKAKA